MVRLHQAAADRTIFDEPHFQSLELLAAQALANGDALSAFKYSDRRCRILPIAEAHCYILRAEASFRLKDKAGAIADIAKALAIAPDDIAANRRMLRWGRGRSRKKSALALIANGENFDGLRPAIEPLRRRADANVSRPNIRRHRARHPSDQNKLVTVIVPVYGDYEATTLCVDMLLAELRASRHRAILVNDATPDRRISRYIARLKADPRVDVLVNAGNLGFIGSVNRALEHVTQGDIVILNSDTIVPKRFVKRLAAVARSSPDIGTVTPLSNNGEFTSFPIPNTFNPLPLRAEVARIDRIAAKANAGRVVDIPSGIGFCLYVRRPCLDKVGPLSEDYGPGYLEDADFCLRARKQGFRNVCAPSVYVGHAGSKSFKDEKRALVVRNLAVLERRFPDHRRECGEFMAADPLRSARQAIELAAAAKTARLRLLVTGTGEVSVIARERADKIAAKGNSAMIVEVCRQDNDTTIKVMDAGGGIPQSLELDLQLPGGRKLLLDYLKTVAPLRIEILDPANTPFALVDLLLKLKTRHDIFIADAGLLGPPDRQPLVGAVHLPEAGGGKASFKNGQPASMTDFWRKVSDGARDIIVPSAAAECFAATVLPHRTSHRTEMSARRVRPPTWRRRDVGARQLGLVSVRCCAQEQKLMSGFYRALSRIRPDVTMTVIGATLDDIDLMRSTRMFVTGPIAAEEFERVLASLRIEYLFVTATRPLFGHPVVSAAESSSLPMAYFDWSASRVAPDAEDLPLDPDASLPSLAAALSDWMG